MKTDKIKVYVSGTDEGDTRVQEVNNKLETFQGLVVGYIETTSFAGLREHGIIIVCNETGPLNGLEPNENVYPFFMVGNVFFTTADNEGDFVSLSDEQIRVIDDFFKL